MLRTNGTELLDFAYFNFFFIFKQLSCSVSHSKMINQSRKYLNFFMQKLKLFILQIYIFFGPHRYENHDAYRVRSLRFSVYLVSLSFLISLQESYPLKLILRDDEILFDVALIFNNEKCKQKSNLHHVAVQLIKCF